MKFTFLWDIFIKIINNFLKIGYFFSKKTCLSHLRCCQCKLFIPCLAEPSDQCILQALIDLHIEFLAELLGTAAHLVLTVIVDCHVFSDLLKPYRIQMA